MFSGEFSVSGYNLQGYIRKKWNVYQRERERDREKERYFYNATFSEDASALNLHT